MKRHTRVLRIVTIGSRTGSYGGPFDTALMQVTISARAGWDASLFVGHFDGDEVVDPLVESVRVRSLSRRAKFSTAWSWRHARRLWSLVRDHDVVHVSIARELIPIFSSWLALAMGRRVVLQPHGMLTSSSGRLHSAIDALIRPVLNRAEVVALTTVEAEKLRSRYGISSPHVLGNPVLSTLEGAVSNSAKEVSSDEVLFLARLHPRKRVLDFAAAAQLSSVGRFTVVGPDGGDLNRLLCILPKAPRLRYEGAIPGASVHARVRQCRVFVLPSGDEPWGNVLVAAIALGKPVVVCASAALAPLIREYSAGIVVEDAAPSAIAAAVTALLEDDVLYAKAADAARKLAASHFSLEQQVAGLSRVYSDHQLSGEVN